MGTVSKSMQTVSKFFTMLVNQRGQAAIIVALMFNVLFVFFAMAINIGLVVHDKINLQNSADMAAYYAASKQAELLNVIAHQNYAIRQSYKLLAWRYRVLGQMGFDRNLKFPARTGDVSENIFGPYVGRDGAPRPSLCITYFPNWREVPENENLCNREGLKIPPLPEVKVIAGFLGLNVAIAALSRQLRAQFDAQCAKAGAINWWFGMSILHAFRIDQRNRKQIMYAIANSMSTNARGGDFIDLDGNSVLAGARETFMRNLTYANRQAMESGQGEFELMNSLEGVRAEQWLKEISIIPTVIYTDSKDTAGCEAYPVPIDFLPDRQSARDLLQAPFPQGFDAKDLIPWTQNGGFLRDSDYQYSIGVEKNPWYMAYVGAKAKVSTRQIFFPMGGSVTNVARAFAKPFGGRIGPWYETRWERGNENSSGGTKTDTLMAPRMVGGGFGNASDDATRLPNYSRFPGDTKGLNAALALNSLNNLRNLSMSFDYFKNIKEEMGPGSPNDIMAWDGNGQEPDIRHYEIAAIAPDLFDVTYYSVEPNFAKNYMEKLTANRAKFNIPFNVPIRSDLGHHGTEKPTYTVQQQMAFAKEKNLPKQEAYYFIRDKVHLLTAWLPGAGAFNYDVQASMANFGRCEDTDDNFKQKNPGSCIARGGRTGYSVKVVSRDMLKGSQHRIGGQGVPPGTILNPPKQDW